MAELRQIEGPDRGRVFPIDADCVVLGRHPHCNIVLDIGAVSRQHAQIVRTPTGYFVEDLNSRNGTFLNEQRLHGRRPLRHGDRIRICDLVFVFHDAPSSTGEGGQSTLTEAAWVEDEERFRTGSTIMSRLDATSPTNRLQVNPEAKLRALMEISQNLGKAIGLEQVLDKVLQSLLNVFTQADRGFVILRDQSTGKLIPRAVRSRRPEDQENLRISKTIVNAVVQSKQAVLSADVATDSRFDLSQSIADFPIHSVMCVPLIGSDGTVLGVIQMDTRQRRARFTQEDLEVLVSVASLVAVVVENAILHEVSVREELLRRELALAHQVQQGFLPSSPPKIDNYEFFDHYDPAHEIGGDYFDYVSLPAKRLAIVLADVSGKGIAAALLMAKLSAEMRYCLVSEGSPQAALKRLNNIFCSERWEDRFITMILAILDPITHRFWLVNAGHYPAILRRADGRIEILGDTNAGLPIGDPKNGEYVAETGVFEPGDVLVLYTDGMLDALNEFGESFGQDRLLEVIRQTSGPVTEIGNALVNAVHRFVGPRAQTDDICLVILGRSANQGSADQFSEEDHQGPSAKLSD